MSAGVARRRPSPGALLLAAVSVVISVVLVALDARGGGGGFSDRSGPGLSESPPAQVIDSNIKLAY